MELKQLKENEINLAENAKSKKKVLSVYNYGLFFLYFFKASKFSIMNIYYFCFRWKKIPLNKNDNIPELNKSTPYRQDQGPVQTSFFMVSVRATAGSTATRSITATHRKMNTVIKKRTQSYLLQ